MFSGIVDHCGKIEEVAKTDTGLSLKISTQFQALEVGESISVDGTCLTVVSHDLTGENKTYFTCDVSPETIQLTLCQEYRLGQEVNLERALKLSDRLGGHLVTGHVDGLGVVATKRIIGEYVAMNIGSVDHKHRRYLTPKGSVAVNGVSFTVNSVFHEGFEIMIIPHTQNKTNVGFLAPGDKVNLEFDYVAKIVVNQATSFERGIDR